MSKQKLGLRVKFSKFFRFWEPEKRVMIEDYLRGGLTKKEVWAKHTGRSKDHGVMLRWMRELGYLADTNEKSSIFAAKNHPMSKKSKLEDDVSSIENLQLHNRIRELEKQLKESELKSVAYQTMIDIAERDLNISIKKKFDTKASKK
jgi:hypothetical protein